MADLPFTFIKNLASSLLAYYYEMLRPQPGVLSRDRLKFQMWLYTKPEKNHELSYSPIMV